MAIIASNAGGNYALAPAGSHIARCCWVIDLGTQNDSFAGKPKRNRKIRIGFEIPEETHVFFEEKGPEPFILSKEYTCLLGDKSNLKKDLESWRGRPFTAEEMKGFSVDKVIGQPCMISVIHKASASDASKMFANITGLSRLPKNTVCPPAITPPIVYEVSEGKSKKFSALPEWIQKAIMNCEEFNAAPPSHAAPEEPETNDESDSNVPF